ncbi:MAG: hypothetical protein V4684_03395, partial [Pseudomonadota bacterium]
QLIRNEKVGCSIHLSGTMSSVKNGPSGPFFIAQASEQSRTNSARASVPAGYEAKKNYKCNCLRLSGANPVVEHPPEP